MEYVSARCFDTISWYTSTVACCLLYLSALFRKVVINLVKKMKMTKLNLTMKYMNAIF